MTDNFDLLIKIAKHLGINTELEERVHNLEKSGTKIIYFQCDNCQFEKHQIHKIVETKGDFSLADIFCVRCNTGIRVNLFKGNIPQ